MKAQYMVGHKHFVALLFSLFMSSNCLAAQYYVRTSGDDDNAGTNRNSAFRTIGKAISVANGYDQIYVGAGTYIERAVQPRVATARSIQLLGDISGGYTGDKGEVEIQSQPSQYALYLYGGQRVWVQDITFTSQRDDARGNGLYVDGTTSYALLYRCKLKGLTTGFSARNCGTAYAYQCDFNDSNRGTYVASANSAYTYDSNYTDCRTAFESTSCKSTLAIGGQIASGLDSSGKPTCYMGIRSRTGEISVSSVNIENAQYGVYASEASRSQIQTVNIKNPTSYGIYLKADQVSVSNVNVEGTDKRGWGVAIWGGQAVPIVQSVRCKGLYGGFYCGNGANAYKDSAASNNRFGLYIPGSVQKYVNADLSGVSISENTYGIYSPRSNNGKYLSIANATLDDNQYGIAGYGDIDLAKCTIRGSQQAIRFFATSFANVTNCNLVGSDDYISSSQGIYLSADSLSVVETGVTNFRTGINLNLIGSQTPKLHDIKLTENTDYGLRVTGGNIELRKDNNVTIDGSTYGLYCSKSSASVDNFAPTNSSYPLTFVYGKAAVRNTVIDKATYGIRSYYQDSVELSNVSSQACASGGAYINRSEAVRISDCKFTDGLRHGVLVYNPVDIVVKGILARGNQYHGLYITAAVAPKRAEIYDCELSDNYYGLYTQRITITPDTVSGLTVTGCRYGIRAFDADVQVTDKSKWKLDDNLYAISSNRGNVDLSKISMENNDYSLVAQYSPAKLTDCKLSCRNINVLLYSGGSSVSNCKLESGRYGLYFAPRSHGLELSVKETEINNTSSSALFSYGDRKQNIPEVAIDGLYAKTARHGVYSYYSNLKANNVQIDSPKAYGLYQVYGSVTISDLTITNGSSWGVISSGDSLALRRAIVESRYGVHLSGKSAQLINSVIKGSTYGVYGNGKGQYSLLQSTLGNISSYGVYLRSGDMDVRNTIVDSGNYGLYVASKSATMKHDYNLVSADRSSFVNATAGLHEIEKEPIFADPLKGDLHLAAGSPAINAGTDLSGISTTDIEGNKRPSFRQFEIGAYEFTENAGSLRILDWAEQSE
ncbi:MAG: hypothetical protein Aurels2KO_37550 [Aureliella sp.]